VRVTSTKFLPFASILCLAVMAGACGEFIRQDRSPVTLVIDRLEAASGADDAATLSSPLFSDVITVVDGVPTVFPDKGAFTMRLIMKDVLSAPSPVNAVTLTRYQVIFRRSDGRNTPGVDVPHSFTSGLTFTVPATGVAAGNFELVRHIAKSEAPLRALVSSPVVISTIAEITFFGRDQAGNELSATGLIGVDFGNFGDPD
jgi:hypothetical protein